MNHWRTPLAVAGAVLFLAVVGVWLSDEGVFFGGDTSDDAGSAPVGDPGGALHGREGESAEPAGTVEAETPPEPIVIGGPAPTRDDVLVRVLGPNGKPLHRAHWRVSDATTRRPVHSSYVDAGNAYIPRDRVPYRAKIVVRPLSGARSQGVLDVELDSVDLLTLGEIRLIEGRLLMGAVRDAEGLEEQGVQVGAFVTRTVAGRRDGHGVKTKTDLDGVYRLFVAPGENVNLWAYSNRVDRARVEVLVPDGGDAPDFELPPEVTLRVEVHDGSGEPVFDVRVELTMPYAEGRRTHRAEDRTDGEGIAAFHGLPVEGIAKIAIRTPTDDHPYLPYQLDGMRLDRGDLRISLERGVDITGRVVRGDGLVVSEGTVSASPLDARVKTAMTTHIRPDGTFAIRGLRRGRYRVTAWGEPKDGWGGSEPVETDAPSNGHELVLKRTYSIQGTFRRGAASGLRAYWWGGESRQEQIVGRHGFKLLGLPGDRGLLYIGAPGDRRYAYRHVDPAKGELGRLEIRKGKCITGQIHGLVLKSEQLPGGGVRSTLATAVLHLEGPGFHFVVPDVGLDGSFKTPGLPPGSYQLLLWDAAEKNLIHESEILEPGASVTLRYR